MIHQLFIVVADKTLGMAQLNVNYVFRFVVYFMIVLCVSYVVFRYIETPIANNLRRQYNAKTNSL